MGGGFGRPASLNPVERSAQEGDDPRVPLVFYCAFLPDRPPFWGHLRSRDDAEVVSEQARDPCLRFVFRGARVLAVNSDRPEKGADGMVRRGAEFRPPSPFFCGYLFAFDRLPSDRPLRSWSRRSFSGSLRPPGPAAPSFAPCARGLLRRCAPRRISTGSKRVNRSGRIDDHSTITKTPPQLGVITTLVDAAQCTASFSERRFLGAGCSPPRLLAWRLFVSLLTDRNERRSCHIALARSTVRRP